jgi:hypothetical protein
MGLTMNKQYYLFTGSKYRWIPLLPTIPSRRTTASFPTGLPEVFKMYKQLKKQKLFWTAEGDLSEDVALGSRRTNGSSSNVLVLR